jgi:hypothetical protein
MCLHYAKILITIFGLIVFSQGISFGRWNEFNSVEFNFNFHAALLSLIGISIIVIGYALGLIIKKIKKLEETHNNTILPSSDELANL